MYKIVCSSSRNLTEAIEQVENEVKNLKSQGWIEQGGVSISSAVLSYDFFDFSYDVAQAMVKKEE